MGTYKLFWIGCEEGILGVGILVAERWVEVKCISERLPVLRIMVGKSVLNLVSVHGPQVGQSVEEKEEFYISLGKILTSKGTVE